MPRFRLAAAAVLLAGGLFAASGVHAGNAATIATPSAPAAPAPEPATDDSPALDRSARNAADSDSAIARNSIELSLALGYGRFESPIVFGTDFVFYALPQLAWYGERGYFENGLFGYAITESSEQQWDAVLYPNSDGLFFNLSGGTVMPLVGTSPFPVPDRLKVLQSPERDISAMAGLRYSRQGDWLSGHLQLGADVSGVHNGWELAGQLGCTPCVTAGPVQFGGELGLTLKSSELVEYYYMPKAGEVDPREGDQYLDDGAIWRTVGPFHGHHGWLGQLQLNAVWPFAAHWSVIASYRHFWLSTALTDTPLLTRADFAAYFGGLQYRF